MSQPFDDRPMCAQCRKRFTANKRSVILLFGSILVGLAGVLVFAISLTLVPMLAVGIGVYGIIQYARPIRCPYCNGTNII